MNYYLVFFNFVPSNLPTDTIIQSAKLFAISSLLFFFQKQFIVGTWDCLLQVIVLYMH